MAGSIIAAVRKAVADGLANEPGLAEVSVSYGLRHDARDRWQVFTDMGRAQTPPAALRAGRNHRNEQAEFRIVVLVIEPGGNAEDADARALECGEVVEEFLADRKSNELGVPGLNWIRAESWDLDGGWQDTAWVSQLVYTVRYDARLT